MKQTVEQISLFDFLSEDPNEAINEPVEVALPKQENKSVLAIEKPPTHFEGIKVGSVCEIIVADPREETLPHLFTETEVGKKIVITELSIDRGTRWVWAYLVQLQPIRSTEEKRSKRLEYDPRCSVAPYQVERLKLIM